MNIRDFTNIWWLFSLSHLASTSWETRKCIGRVQELRQKCKRGGVDKLFFMNEGQVVGIRLSRRIPRGGPAKWIKSSLLDFLL